MTLDPDLEPEPDVSVVAGSPHDTIDHHPVDPALVVEVADRSLWLDRTVKGRLYARAAAPEYWIVNLVDGVLEIYHAPEQQGRRRKYADIQVLGPEGTVSPLAAPAAGIPIADLLP